MHKSGALPLPLSIKLLRLTEYSKHFNADNECINFLLSNKNFSKKYNELWDKIKSLYKKEFDKKSLYSNIYIIYIYIYIYIYILALK